MDLPFLAAEKWAKITFATFSACGCVRDMNLMAKRTFFSVKECSKNVLKRKKVFFGCPIPDGRHHFDGF